MSGISVLLTLHLWTVKLSMVAVEGVLIPSELTILLVRLPSSNATLHPKSSAMPPAPDLSGEPWLASVLGNAHHGPTSASPLLLVSSESHSLSPLPIIKHFIRQATPSHPVILLSALIPPSKSGVSTLR